MSACGLWGIENAGEDGAGTGCRLRLHAWGLLAGVKGVSLVSEGVVLGIRPGGEEEKANMKDDCILG